MFIVIEGCTWEAAVRVKIGYKTCRWAQFQLKQLCTILEELLGEKATRKLIKTKMTNS